MNEIAKPRIIISKCIEFDNCRYNGQIISSNEIKELIPYVEFIPVCPEMEIGLGVPRNPIRIVFNDKKSILLQPATKKDFTNKMKFFSRTFLDSLKEIDGFVLKSRSPSCGLKDVKIYTREKQIPAIAKSAGFFGEEVIKKFPNLAIEDEGRLRNPTIREHFLRTVYTYARFRLVKSSLSLSKLISFHTQHKFIFMAYNQQQLKNLGQIIANQNHYSLKKILKDYEKHLHLIFKKSPKCTSNINVLMHSFGYFKDKLSKKEKSYFLDSLELYRKGRISLASLIGIIKSWIVRFDEKYLDQQQYFSPYPEQLIHADNIDSCLSRNYWK